MKSELTIEDILKRKDMRNEIISHLDLQSAGRLSLLNKTVNKFFSVNKDQNNSLETRALNEIFCQIKNANWQEIEKLFSKNPKLLFKYIKIKNINNQEMYLSPLEYILHVYDEEGQRLIENIAIKNNLEDDYLKQCQEFNVFFDFEPFFTVLEDWITRCKVWNHEEVILTDEQEKKYQRFSNEEMMRLFIECIGGAQKNLLPRNFLKERGYENSSTENIEEYNNSNNHYYVNSSLPPYEKIDFDKFSIDCCVDNKTLGIDFAFVWKNIFINSTTCDINNIMDKNFVDNEIKFYKNLLADRIKNQKLNIEMFKNNRDEKYSSIQPKNK